MPTSNSGGDLVDARGVEIAPGDTAIYGFGVGRSVAMAEAVVLGEHMHAYKVFARTDYCLCGDPWPCDKTPSVSLTPKGRVRLRVVRRSYGSGEKPVVDVAPDRLVVLKPMYTVAGDVATLPPSPLPTQDVEARKRIEDSIRYHTKCLRYPEENMGDYWESDVARYLRHHNKELAAERRKLKDIDGST